MTWKCPHCENPAGVEVMEMLPSSHTARFLEDGSLEVDWEECKVNWDGTGVYEICCLSCGGEIKGVEFA